MALYRNIWQKTIIKNHLNNIPHLAHPAAASTWRGPGVCGALASGLPTGWTADWNRVSPRIGASREIAGETTMAWLLPRVHELEAAKIFAALPRWRRHERLGDDDETG